MKKLFLFVWEVSKIVIVASLIVLPIRYLIFQPFFVRGQSMEPNFHNGDYLIIDELSYQFRGPQRGEVIVFKYPGDLSQRYIKRVIGLPGETVKVESNQIFVSESGSFVLLDEAYLPDYIETPGNVETTLGPDEYFVLGDNRPLSSDSRRWGVLPKDDIIGRVFFRAWPFEVLAKIDTPDY